jgi:cytochrome c oxidase assembly protein subunit 11
MNSYAATHKTNNIKTLMVLLVILGLMIGLVAVSVPLYRLFCQVTGYGGTTQVAEAGNTTILGRKMTIRFNSDVNSLLPWHF